MAGLSGGMLLVFIGLIGSRIRATVTE